MAVSWKVNYFSSVRLVYMRSLNSGCGAGINMRIKTIKKNEKGKLPSWYWPS